MELDGTPLPCARVHAGRIDLAVKAHAPGAVSVAVRNPDGQRATLGAALRFADPPVVVEVLPPASFPVGGDELRVFGRGFEPGAVVIVGDAAVETVRFASRRSCAFPHLHRLEAAPATSASASSIRAA